MPVHCPLLGRNAVPICAKVEGSTGASSPAFCTTVMAGEFSVRNTSAGDRLPSATIWLPIDESLPWRTCTSMPVCWVKPLTQAATIFGSCAL